MRAKIWRFVRSGTIEGTLLPWWALVIRAVLYPLDFFYWRMSQAMGYQWNSDVWLIEGIRYSGAAMRSLANSNGHIFRIKVEHGLVWLEEINPNELRQVTVSINKALH